MRKNLFILAFVAILSSSLFANNFSEKNLLVQLYSCHDSCILNASDEKYYLNTDKLVVNENGIFLITDSFGVLPLTSLIQDDRGLYTVGLYGIWRCNGCFTYYNDQPTQCGVCGGTSFTFIDYTED